MYQPSEGDQSLFCDGHNVIKQELVAKGHAELYKTSDSGTASLEPAVIYQASDGSRVTAGTVSIYQASVGKLLSAEPAAIYQASDGVRVSSETSGSVQPSDGTLDIAEHVILYHAASIHAIVKLLLEEIAVMRKESVEPGVIEEEMVDSINFVELLNSTICKVESDENPTTMELLATLSIKLQLGPNAPMVDKLLDKFPPACNLTGMPLHPEYVDKEIMCEQCTSAKEEQDNIVQFRQLIIFVNLQLQFEIQCMPIYNPSSPTGVRETVQCLSIYNAFSPPSRDSVKFLVLPICNYFSQEFQRQ